jgi:hypothetical protein
MKLHPSLISKNKPSKKPSLLSGLWLFDGDDIFIHNVRLSTSGNNATRKKIQIF